MPAEKKPYKLVVAGPFYEHSGYSYINRRIVRELMERKWDVGVETLSCLNDVPRHEANFYNALRDHTRGGKPKLYTSVDPETNGKIVKVVCWIPLSMPRHRHNICYTMTETRLLSPKGVGIINSFYDSCWVPSNYYREAFAESGVNIPIHHAPVGIDSIFCAENVRENARFNYKTFKKGKPVYNAKPSGYRFLSLFRWTARKGFDVLLKSYLQEFRECDDVSLVIFSRHVAATSAPAFYNAIENDIRRYVEEFGDGAPAVYWCHDNVRTELMPSVYASGDCFVLPSRGEGICLPPLEASQMGLPTILPSHTGFSDYVSEETSFVLDVDQWAVCDHEPIWSGWLSELYAGQEYPRFGDKTVEQLGSLMRQAMENPELAKAKNEAMKRLIAERYSWKICGDTVDGLVSDVYEGIG